MTCRDNHSSRPLRRSGFTLIELLISVGIVVILASLLLVAVSAVRQQARTAESKARIATIEAGLSAYRTASGAPFPPSSNIGIEDSLNHAGKMYDNPSEVAYSVYGANLLVWALAGADLLGSAGFPDRDGEPINKSLLYGVDDNGNPKHRRQPVFVDLDADDFSSVEEFRLPPSVMDLAPLKERVLVDAFGFPILYYKANPWAGHMVVGGGHDGIYSQSDNAMFTGETEGEVLGVDLGAGYNHRLNTRVKTPFGDTFKVDPDPDPQEDDLNESLYDGSFAKFIWDRKITARNLPVNRESYMLICAGADALYGTDDDVTNFITGW